MPEYYGYKAPEQADFGKSISNVAELFVKAEEKRAAKRETEQKSLDESRKKINEIEQNSNQSQAELVGSGANKTRAYILELERMRKSGKITGEEFNRSMTNVNDSWDNYAFTIKNMNERLAENIARQQVGEDGKIPASSNEIFNAKVQADLMNTKNKDFMIGNDGTLYMVDKNNPDKPISLKSTGNIENIVDNRVNVYDMIQNGISNWGDFTIESGMTTEEGARLQKQYDASKYDLVHSIVDENNPRGVVSILMDNAGEDYDQYYTNTQKEQLLNDAVKREESLKGPMNSEQKAKFRSEYEKNNMIEYVMDENGALQPVVTKKMIDDAYNFVDQSVEMSVGGKTTEDEDRGGKGGGPSGDNKDQVELTDYDRNVAQKVVNAWSSKDWKKISALTNNKYYFIWEDDGKGNKGLAVYTENPYTYKQKKAEYDSMTREERSKKGIKEPEAPKRERELIQNAEGLSDFFFGESESSRNKWSKAVHNARANKSTTNTTTRKPTTATTSQKPFNG